MEFILRRSDKQSPGVGRATRTVLPDDLAGASICPGIFSAANGSSPLHWIHLSLDANRSAIDWPTGTRNLGNSFIINIYSFLYDHFLIDPMSTLTVMMGIEILLVSFAFVFFGRTILGSLTILLFTFLQYWWLSQLFNL